MPKLTLGHLGVDRAGARARRAEADSFLTACMGSLDCLPVDTASSGVPLAPLCAPCPCPAAAHDAAGADAGAVVLPGQCA